MKSTGILLISDIFINYYFVRLRKVTQISRWNKSDSVETFDSPSELCDSSSSLGGRVGKSSLLPRYSIATANHLLGYHSEEG